MTKYVWNGKPEIAEILNDLDFAIRHSNQKKPNAVLYVGHRQWYAIQTIGSYAPNTFQGWPVVQVQAESYIHLAEKPVGPILRDI